MDYSKTDQDLLHEALAAANNSAAEMETFMNNKGTDGAIKYAIEMTDQLKINGLSPKAYYKLYHFVTEKLRMLEAYLINEHKMQRQVKDLYMKVQSSAFIVPRLYLMITVGVYLMKCGACSTCEIINDLLEMCRGVQHSMRGLFLRDFLLKSLVNELLPGGESREFTPNGNSDAHSVTTANDEYSENLLAKKGSLQDTISFMLVNFSEMNKLWVRMQYQGHSRDRRQREEERQQLRNLVGSTLTRLSQLEAVDVDCYRQEILPMIFEQVVKCNDLIAQTYLMEVIIQVFPDEFHVKTLDIFLSVCGRLNSEVKLSPIICDLVNRLSHYVKRERVSAQVSQLPSDDCKTAEGETTGTEASQDPSSKSTGLSESASLELFNTFSSGLISLVQQRMNETKKECEVKDEKNNGLPCEDVPTIFRALLDLGLLLCPGLAKTLVEKCFNNTEICLKALGVTAVLPRSRLATELQRLLAAPLDFSGFSVPACKRSETEQPKAPLVLPIDLCTLINISGFQALTSLLDVTTTKCDLASVLLSFTIEWQNYCRTVAISNPDASGSPPAGVRVLSENFLNNLFDLFSGMLQAIPNKSSPIAMDDFNDNQDKLAGLLHLLGPEDPSEDPELCHQLLLKSYLRLKEAGPDFIRFHFPTIFYKSLRLLRATVHLSRASERDWSGAIQDMVQLIRDCITSLVEAESTEVALKLYLEAAVLMDGLEFAKRDVVVYECISQALTLHEEGVHMARNQVRTLSAIINTVYRVVHLEQESRRTLCTHCTRAATQLLQKHDQSLSVAMVAHVYWPRQPLLREHVKNYFTSTETVSEPVDDQLFAQLRDGQLALNCLKKSYSLASDCSKVNTQVELFLECLDVAVGLRLNGCTQITDSFLNDLISSVRKLLNRVDFKDVGGLNTAHLNNTLDFIRSHQLAQDGVSTFFATVNIQPFPVGSA